MNGRSPTCVTHATRNVITPVNRCSLRVWSWSRQYRHRILYLLSGMAMVHFKRQPLVGQNCQASIYILRYYMSIVHFQRNPLRRFPKDY